jgi:heme-degrading monooxygenase HmoA
MTIRVICKATVAVVHQQAFEEAYLKVAARVGGTPGHLRDMLLRSAEDGNTYLLLAEWESEELFRAWADDPRHIEMSAPMFPYWGGTFERHIYQVRQTFDPNPAPDLAAATATTPAG